MPTNGVAGAALAPFGIFIPELVAGQLNAGGVGIYETDFGGDGNRFSPQQGWVTHKPEGLRGAKRALTTYHGTLGGTYTPQYELLARRARQVFGLPYQTGIYTADGSNRPYERFRLPERGQGPSIDTFSHFYGTDSDAVESVYGFISGWGITHARLGEVSGTLTPMLCRIKSESTAMPGVTAQTEVQSLIATAAHGPVTVHHGISGGSTFVVTPGDSAATVQTAARAAGMTGVTVAGTTAAVGAGTAEVQTLAITSLPPGPIFLTVTPPVGGPQTISVNAESATINTDLAAELNALYGAGLVGVTGGPLTASSGPTYSGTLTLTFNASLGNVTQVTPAAGQTGVVANTTTPGVLSSNGTVNLAFTYAGQANTNEPLITLTGTYAPNYTAATVTQGSAGGDYYVPTSPYVDSDHFLIYKASSLTDLLTIDPSNVPSDASAGDSHIILSAEGGGFDLTGLADFHYVDDRKLFPQGHVALDPTVGWNIILPKDSAGRCEEIRATENGCVATEFYTRFAARCGDWEMWMDLFGSREAAPSTPVSNGIAQRQFTFGRTYNMAAYNDVSNPWGSCVLTLFYPVGFVVP